ncbi:hypothetical protein [Stakelama pacifica]|uniref:Uncharacterized protein n=1 Tax=Stakelama pacifica TaxID=517720 RepID=A0A4R6FPL8_9SPHN|nr:hypothetical protein [Stakelama pacifica]MAW99703.1 hypothetical protein [Sphingomonas sp.]TDN83611.1 hypothetical protein EV664_10495 [Stakelama pacifica]GGO94319.1 hypothetical protein GCM10011329_15840 [Stakelama pacifica]
MIHGARQINASHAESPVGFHGPYRHQQLVDAIVAAVRAGDDDAVNRLDRVLRELERQQRHFR